MLRNILVLILLFSFTYTSAQNGRKVRDVFPTHGNFERRGWVFSPGLTYMVPSLQRVTGAVHMSPDSIYDIEYNPSGRIGLLAEVSRFSIIESTPLISTMDFGIGFKLMRGIEEFEATLRDDLSRPYILNGEGVFNRGSVYTNFNINKIHQFSDYSFVKNSIGLNLDYALADKFSYNNKGLFINENAANKLIFQLHYKLGFGFKISEGIIIEPNIETPILTIFPFDEAKSTDLFFNTRYRPVLLRISIWMFDSKKDRKCPAGTKPGKRSGKPRESLWEGTSGKPW